MAYFLSFLEGIITFVSPCLLPMLPVYLAFFMGQKENGKKSVAVFNSIGFVIGFSIVFTILGAFSGGVGKYLAEYKTAVNVVSGVFVLLFGLLFMDIIHVSFFNQTKRLQMKTTHIGFFSAILFGIIFAVGWTPCVGAFLGSALMLAASSGSSSEGIIRLLFYSAGLGIPFIISAMLIDRLKGAFDFIKKHYRAVHLISGGFLIVVGILMMTGLMGTLLSLFTF